MDKCNTDEVKLLVLERRRNTSKLKDIYYTIVNANAETKKERYAILDKLAKKHNTTRDTIKTNIKVLIELNLVKVDQSLLNHV